MKMKKNDNKLNYYDKKRYTVVVEPEIDELLVDAAKKEDRKLGTMASILIKRALLQEKTDAQN